MDVEGIVIAGNRMQGSGTSPVRIVNRGASMPWSERANEISWDYPLTRDIARLLQSRIGPGLWLLLFFIVLGGPLIVAFFQRLPLGRRLAPVRDVARRVAVYMLAIVLSRPRSPPRHRFPRA